LAAALALLRWLRVSQREHYIAGSCSTVLWRWVRRRPPNLLLDLAITLGAVVSVVLAIAGDRPAAPLIVLLTALVAAAFPFPMPILGRGTRLNLTRRARILGLATLLLAGLVYFVAWLLGAGLAGPIVAALAMPALVDTAAAITAP